MSENFSVATKIVYMTTQNAFSCHTGMLSTLVLKEKNSNDSQNSSRIMYKTQNLCLVSCSQTKFVTIILALLAFPFSYDFLCDQFFF